MAEQNYGALTGLNLDEIENQGIDPITYNVYQTRSQNTGKSDQDIQSLYGTSQMPVFEWVKKIQSGQRTYNPQDAFENDLMEEYKRMNEQGQVPEGMMTPQEIMAQQALQGTAGQIGTVIGKPIGDALVNPAYANMNIGDKLIQGTKNIYSKTPQETLANASKMTAAQREVLRQNPNISYEPQIRSAETAEALGLTTERDAMNPYRVMGKDGKAIDGFYKKDAANKILGKDQPLGTIEQQQLVPSDTVELADGSFSQSGLNPESTGRTTYRGIDGVELASIQGANPVGYLEGVGDRLNPFTDAGASNFSSAASAGLFNFGFRVAAGQDIDDAAKSAADAGAITYLTTALLTATPLAPFATIIGGVVGGFVGRVICNELMRQGIMDRKQVILDYKFTRDYLTPTHVAGYHVWAVWMVKQMRKGRLVKLWSHIAGHRANEIAYIYGERDKPDYLGKLYRKILEPICWTVGTFCKETDWSILYKKKEI